MISLVDDQWAQLGSPAQRVESFFNGNRPAAHLGMRQPLRCRAPIYIPYRRDPHARQPWAAPGWVPLLVFLLWSVLPVTAASSDVRAFDVPAGEAAQTLKVFAAQAGRE